MPVLWAYARDLFQTPGFGDTVDFVQIKQHYYIVHADINPTRIVPKRPAGQLADPRTERQALEAGRLVMAHHLDRQSRVSGTPVRATGRS